MRTTTAAGTRPGYRMRRMAGLLVVAGMVTTGAACGSDDDGGDGLPPPETDLELEMTDPPASDAEADSESDTESRLEAAGGDYCEVVESFGTDIFAGVEPDSGEDAYTTLVDAYREIEEAAPDEVAGEWATLADAMETMSTIDYTDPEAAEQLAVFEDIEPVSAKLDQHFREECG